MICSRPGAGATKHSLPPAHVTFLQIYSCSYMHTKAFTWYTSSQIRVLPATMSTRRMATGPLIIMDGQKKVTFWLSPRKHTSKDIRAGVTQNTSSNQLFMRSKISAKQTIIACPGNLPIFRGSELTNTLNSSPIHRRHEIPA